MPSPPTCNEYLLRYAKALGAVPMKRIPMASETGNQDAGVPLKVLEIAMLKIGGTYATLPPIPASFLRLAGQEIQLDSTHARQLLGWEYGSLEQGLVKTAACYGSRASRSFAAADGGLGNHPVGRP